MARYRRHRSRVYAARGFRKARRSFGGIRGGGGIIGNVFDGALVGVAQQIIPDDLVFGMADPLAMIGVGWFRKNQTLQTLGGYQLGAKIASQFFGPKPVTAGGSRGVY